MLQRMIADMKAALKAGEKEKLQVVRMLKSRLQEKEVERRGKEGPDYELTDDEAMQVIASYAKQRRDSETQYREAGRDDLADKEAAELKIVAEGVEREDQADRLRDLGCDLLQGYHFSKPKPFSETLAAALATTEAARMGS